MKKSMVVVFGLMVFFGLTVCLFAGDDDWVQAYPDGGYGIDIGGGYAVMPDGELLAPAGYREEYRDSPYGPMTAQGFTVFPGFKFTYDRYMESRDKKEEPVRDYIFHEPTTNTAGSMFWGISSPRKSDQRN